jgi:hypothetical protein
MSLKNSRTSVRAKALGFRSGFESDVADTLHNLGVKFDYEHPVKCCFNYYKPINKGRLLNEAWQEVKIGDKNRIAQLCSYTTDYVIYKQDGTPHFYVETKGRFTASDRSKHRLIKEQYPEVDLRILFQNNGKATPKLTYKAWCDKFNITCGFIKRKTKTDPGLYFEQDWIQELYTHA